MRLDKVDAYKNRARKSRDFAYGQDTPELREHDHRAGVLCGDLERSRIKATKKISKIIVVDGKTYDSLIQASLRLNVAASTLTVIYKDLQKTRLSNLERYVTVKTKMTFSLPKE